MGNLGIGLVVIRMPYYPFDRVLEHHICDLVARDQGPDDSLPVSRYNADAL